MSIMRKVHCLANGLVDEPHFMIGGAVVGEGVGAFEIRPPRSSGVGDFINRVHVDARFAVLSPGEANWLASRSKPSESSSSSNALASAIVHRRRGGGLEVELCRVISKRRPHTERGALADSADAGMDAARRVQHSFQQENRRQACR